MPYEVNRSRFEAVRREWSEHGNVKVRPFRKGENGETADVDYMRLERECTRETVELVGQQMLALAIKSGAYFTCFEHGYGWSVGLSLRCVGVDGPTTDEEVRQ